MAQDGCGVKVLSDYSGLRLFDTAVCILFIIASYSCIVYFILFF